MQLALSDLLSQLSGIPGISVFIGVPVVSLLLLTFVDWSPRLSITSKRVCFGALALLFLVSATPLFAVAYTVLEVYILLAVGGAWSPTHVYVMLIPGFLTSFFVLILLFAWRSILVR